MKEVPSHDVALWLLSEINKFLDFLGLKHDKSIEELIYVLVVGFGALFIGWVLQLVILIIAKKIIDIRKYIIGKELVAHKVITRVSHIIPPLICLIFIPFAFASKSTFVYLFLKGVVVVYLSITIGVAISAFFTFLWQHYDNYKNEKNHPLRGVLNITKGVVWILILIITTSNLLGRSPIVLLTGLGAFAAALMLVFKDSILGFVAGVQLSQNDMLRVGDWIAVPSTIANGIVEDVSLSVVKVRNWDNTMVMLPPYMLVSSSFQNWRGMIEANSQLITFSVKVNSNSVKQCDAVFLRKMYDLYPQLSSIEITEHRYEGGIIGLNGNAFTNLGLFRLYLCNYIKEHQMVSKQGQILVRLLEITNEGIPLQIYCYVNTTDWAIYEAVQSEMIEHVISKASQFDLLVFNSISAEDLQRSKI